MIKYEITIASGSNESTSLVLKLSSQCVVGLEIPASITATSFTIQGKGADGQWKDLQLNDADYEVAAAGNTIQPLRPDVMAAAREVRVLGDTNEGADRSLYFVVRDIN